MHSPAPTTLNATARAGRCGAIGSAGTSFSRVKPGTHRPKCIGGPMQSAGGTATVAAPDCPLGQPPLQPTTTPSTHAHVGSCPRCKHEEPPTAWDSYACASTLRHVAVQPQKQISPPPPVASQRRPLACSPNNPCTRRKTRACRSETAVPWDDEWLYSTEGHIIKYPP